MDIRRRNQVTVGVVAAAVILLGMGAVSLTRAVGTPGFSSSVTFFLQSDAEPASNAGEAMAVYASSLDGAGMASRLIDELHLDLTVSELQEEIEVTQEAGTVLLTATVTDPAAERSLAISRAIAADLGTVTAEADPRAAAGRDLVVVSAPELDPASR